MANDFKNAKLALGTTSNVIYTCPANTKAMIILAQVSNIHGTDSADVTISWTDASDSNISTSLVSTVKVPADASFSPIDGKLILEAGDTLKGLASVNNSLVITVSVMEMA